MSTAPKPPKPEAGLNTEGPGDVCKFPKAPVVGAGFELLNADIGSEALAATGLVSGDDGGDAIPGTSFDVDA